MYMYIQILNTQGTDNKKYITKPCPNVHLYLKASVYDSSYKCIVSDMRLIMREYRMGQAKDP